MICYEMPHMH